MKPLLPLKQQEKVVLKFQVRTQPINPLLGYCGYVPGVKSENVFGESYGKTSGASGNGEINRGFDLASEEKFKSMAHSTY